MLSAHLHDSIDSMEQTGSDNLRYTICYRLCHSNNTVSFITLFTIKFFATHEFDLNFYQWFMIIIIKHTYWHHPCSYLTNCKGRGTVFALNFEMTTIGSANLTPETSRQRAGDSRRSLAAHTQAGHAPWSRAGGGGGGGQAGRSRRRMEQSRGWSRRASAGMARRRPPVEGRAVSRSERPPTARVR